MDEAWSPLMFGAHPRGMPAFCRARIRVRKAYWHVWPDWPFAWARTMRETGSHEHEAHRQRHASLQRIWPAHRLRSAGLEVAAVSTARAEDRPVRAPRAIECREARARSLRRATGRQDRRTVDLRISWPVLRFRQLRTVGTRGAGFARPAVLRHRRCRHRPRGRFRGLDAHRSEARRD